MFLPAQLHITLLFLHSIRQTTIAGRWPDRLHSDVREDRGTCAPTDVPVIMGERIVMF